MARKTTSSNCASNRGSHRGRIAPRIAPRKPIGTLAMAGLTTGNCAVIEADELAIAPAQPAVERPEGPGVEPLGVEGLGLGEQVRRFEAALIEGALRRFPTTRAAARHLGVSKSTIVRKMKGARETRR
ncbi:helix-turn-helix domain-containing protein [Xanthobacter sp. KR7-225]|uniref:helix-turn-helix domain-containing protein n=1 Tax=Xanthobacter sp. KR7-225 TaxID=3156613 RepID=UPI0032B615C3